MQSDTIAALVAPFLSPPGLSPLQLQQVSGYLDLLLQWNPRINLTAIRTPEEIVTRHFGESFFLARTLDEIANLKLQGADCADIGAGAGFPGLPLKLYAPRLRLTLIESRSKKAAFLKEVIRKLGLADATVFAGRAEAWPAAQTGRETPSAGAAAASHLPHLVTLRAVERFHRTLPVAARMLAPAGCLALLIAQAQLAPARAALPGFSWQPPALVPQSRARVVLVGIKPAA